MAEKELTYGERKAGVDFNPGGKPEVNQLKAIASVLFDEIKQQRDNPSVTGEALEFYMDAEKHLVLAQMLAVKGATWKW